MNQSLRALRGVELDVSNIEYAARFFTETWGLTEVARDGGAVYLRGTDRFHHILVLREGRPTIRRVVFEAVDRSAVERLHAAVVAAGVGGVEAPSGLQQPGGGFGFGFEDPEGRNLAIVTGVEEHADAELAAERPMRVAHVNVNCRDADLVCRFMLDVLDFRLTDETKRAFFVRCNRNHSSLVLTRATRATLNHVAFEVPDLDAVMCGAGRMRDSGYPIEWGVGRHGPGNNIFAYFLGPDDHEPHGPDYWTWPPGRTDKWGASPPVSKRFERIQGMFEFPRSAYGVNRKR